MPHPGEIYFLDEPKLGNATHGHYALRVVLIDSQGMADINFIATEPWSRDDLRIDALDADFASRALKQTSHLLRNQTFRVPVHYLTPHRLRGSIQGDLRARISDWWGEEI